MFSTRFSSSMGHGIEKFKNKLFLLVLIISCSLDSNGVVFAYPKEDIVMRLPGQPEVGFKQFAGYIDVDEKAGRSFFYYFVEAEKNASDLPLTLWLNGGPGCSSIGGGAFTELGPFFPTGDGRGLRINKESWNKVSNLLFVEAPAGVGFSYSNRTADYTNSGDDSTAKDMVTFMLKWLEKFPTFKSRPLFLTGESYAGHYIPQLAVGLLNYNEQSKNLKLNIKGVALGNPLLRLNKDIPSKYEFWWSRGMISDEIMLIIRNECKFDGYLYADQHNVSNSCNQALNETESVVSNYINGFDVILDVCYPSIAQQELKLRKTITKKSVGVDVCMSEERNLYLNLPEVQRALHANRTNLRYPWIICNEKTLKYNKEDPDRDILPLLKEITKYGISIWVFSGDQDSVIPVFSSRTLVRELAQELNLNITVPYGVWFHKGQVGGWEIEYGNILTFATVRGAAHMVPYSQPARALHLFTSFVKGQRLPNTTFPEIGGPPSI
ncbi:serine protease [Lithospermum erythrorhizon]|uniref:Carboxypeptidase n=1 Tax=Lithospermum erythrorhizon TaxID=34254 RepID=A0AAV3PRQ5_LITER